MPETRSIDIAEVLRDAQLGDLRMLAEERMGYDELHQATEALFDLLDRRDVGYVLVGGLAVLQYIPNRNTRDIDLILAPREVGKLPELALESRDADFARASFRGVQIDLLLTSNPVFALVEQRFSTAEQFGSRKIRCATPEGLVLMKLFALPSIYRQRDLGRMTLYEGDIQWLIGELGVDAEPLIKLLEPHMLATDIAQLRTLAGEIARKIDRLESPSD